MTLPSTTLRATPISKSRTYLKRATMAGSNDPHHPYTEWYGASQRFRTVIEQLEVSKLYIAPATPNDQWLILHTYATLWLSSLAMDNPHSKIVFLYSPVPVTTCVYIYIYQCNSMYYIYTCIYMYISIYGHIHALSIHPSVRPSVQTSTCTSYIYTHTFGTII